MIVYEHDGSLPKLLGGDSQLDRVDRCTAVDIEAGLGGFLGWDRSHGEW